MRHDTEMYCWQEFNGEKLTVGDHVKATTYGENIESLDADKTFMVTSLKINDKQELVIGLNDGSKECTKTHQDHFRMDDLQPV